MYFVYSGQVKQYEDVFLSHDMFSLDTVNYFPSMMIARRR